MSGENIHSFCIAGTNSGVGKTIITLALIRAFANSGRRVQPFKCGPDYIDTEYHTKAAGQDSYNLDTWMMGEEEVKNTFNRKMQNADVGIVEGVMGLFDGAAHYSLKGSSAGVAELLKIPIILVVNAKSLAQSVAAVVKGYHTLYSNIKIAGVIANNVGSKRHEEIIAKSLDAHGLPPLIGSIPKNKVFELSERHLGLTPDFETAKQEEWFNEAAKIILENIDIDKLLKISEVERPQYQVKPKSNDIEKISLGLAYDEAFHFYYKDNLDLLIDNGFDIVKFSPLNDERIPDNLDCIYIGGGFPEMFAKRLSANTTMMKSIKDFADSGKPIFAECGGYMYLVEAFKDGTEISYPMCNILSGIGRMEKRLQRFGYKNIYLKENCLLGEEGTTLKGHEFHWSVIDKAGGNDDFLETRGLHDEEWFSSGQVYKNVCASYLHLHLLSNPKIIDNMRGFIIKLRKGKKR